MSKIGTDLLFSVTDASGKKYEIFCDGRVTGFGKEPIVVNYFLSQVAVQARYYLRTSTANQRKNLRQAEPEDRIALGVIGRFFRLLLFPIRYVLFGRAVL